MPCYHPIPAWTTTSGDVLLKEPDEDTKRGSLKLPCGKCIGCRANRAREWSIRCSLESASHSTMCWTTLTYEEKQKPPTLSKAHLSGFLKRLRARNSTSPLAHQRIRFFASGEYGETTERPHYHAILWGVPPHSTAVQQAWPFGYARVDTLSDAAIAYVAGYTSKKLAEKPPRQFAEAVDPETGEYLGWRPIDDGWQRPFIQMSRRPGIGANAKTHWRSWRATAIHHGHEVAAPRFLHKEWLDKASQQQLDQLHTERLIKMYEKTKKGDYDRYTLNAAEQNALAQDALRAQRRNTL